MKTGLVLYNLILALWIGGNALFTFLVTPILFKTYGRDKAGEIVGNLFPSYFTALLVLSILALVVFLIFIGTRGKFVHQMTLMLIMAALVINAFVSFKLYPDIKKVKQEILSLERTSPDRSAEKRFRRLHGLSFTLNMFLLADGVTLLCIASLLKGSD